MTQLTVAAASGPVLAAAWTIRRAHDKRRRAERWLAVASGLILAIDLNLWHESITLIGAGLATVIANVQVVFVAVAAWILYGERPRSRTVATIASVLTGVALTSGLARADAYGSSPAAGVAVGVLAGLFYAAFLLVFRAANRSLAPTSGPLLDSTIGTVAGALLCVPFDPRFALVPAWPAHLWLVLLALLSQVVGWLLIATALPRLPAVETSIILLVQPVFAVVWGMLLFAEHLSALQWTGSVLVLGGVATLSAGGAVTAKSS